MLDGSSFSSTQSKSKLGMISRQKTDRLTDRRDRWNMGLWMFLCLERVLDASAIEIIFEQGYGFPFIVNCFFQVASQQQNKSTYSGAENNFQCSL